MWTTLGKCQVVSEFVRDYSENVRIQITTNPPKTSINKGFPVCPRARARKNKKKLFKNAKKIEATPKNVDNFSASKPKNKTGHHTNLIALYTAPQLRLREKGGYAATLNTKVPKVGKVET